jgi:hypothetical protein
MRVTVERFCPLMVPKMSHGHQALLLFGDWLGDEGAFLTLFVYINHFGMSRRVVPLTLEYNLGFHLAGRAYDSGAFLAESHRVLFRSNWNVGDGFAHVTDISNLVARFQFLDLGFLA